VSRLAITKLVVCVNPGEGARILPISFDGAWGSVEIAR
jgi:hypothetical protein